jgi:hypothetical protein
MRNESLIVVMFIVGILYVLCLNFLKDNGQLGATRNPDRADIPTMVAGSW